MKLSKTQRHLLDLMNRGWTAIIYFDDKRTRYISPDSRLFGERGNSHTVQSLLDRGLIEMIKISRNKQGMIDACEYGIMKWEG